MTGKRYIEHNPDNYNNRGCYPYKGEPIPEEELAYYGRGPLEKFSVFGVLEQGNEAFLLIKLSRDKDNKIIPHYYLYLGNQGEWKAIPKDELAAAAYNAVITLERG